ncbi:MAG: hypothetical protein OET44_18745 [Gammaproteobacteria bacterium]|nr:hypothetical protein [Gammaproteobacteria bacterium]
MRVLISALCIAFAIGGSAWAGENCDWGSSSKIKKNDFETPPPVVIQEQGQIKG